MRSGVVPEKKSANRSGRVGGGEERFRSSGKLAPDFIRLTWMFNSSKTDRWGASVGERNHGHVLGQRKTERRNFRVES